MRIRPSGLAIQYTDKLILDKEDHFPPPNKGGYINNTLVAKDFPPSKNLPKIGYVKSCPELPIVKFPHVDKVH